MTVAIEVWHVRGTLRRGNRILFVSVPVEATSAPEAIANVCGRYRCLPLELEAHHCVDFERELARWTAAIFEDVRAAARGDR